MTGVRQAKSDLIPSERPRGVLLEFPAGHTESVPPPDTETEIGPSLTYPMTPAIATPVDSCMPAERLGAPVFPPSRAAMASATAFPASQPPTPASPVRPGQPTAESTAYARDKADPPRTRKNWFLRWLNPDPPDQDKRQAARNQVPGLIAHFWTGGAPQAHPVRDISASGLYVVTTERWYLGTLIRVTLTRTSKSDSLAPKTLTVQAIAKRWGDDGVGLAFVPTDSRNPFQGLNGPINGANASQLQQFVSSLPTSSGATH